ncbi:PH domain-containing protein [Allosaccharopolyspora coralli]|uniref:PH domain-containing protein n=1 Tax=Allosaccharopolyspora coralli TaxID=2665642 RepID=UPI001E2DC31E|nr:PH domain-containing protein [Allosaccharopolyspora coralli]
MSSESTSVEARPQKIRRIAIPAAIVLVIVFTFVAVQLKNTPTGAYFRVSDQVAMVGLGILLALGVLRFTFPRLYADADKVEVRNIIGTTRYEWDTIQGFSFPDGAPWARLELPDDEYAPVMAIQANDGDYAIKAMRDLRALQRSVEAD